MIGNPQARHWTMGWTMLLAAALLAGCEGTDAIGAIASTPEPSGPVPSRSPSEIPDFGAAEDMATGIQVPWGVAFLPGGDALVSERQTGRVLRINPGDGDVRQVYQVPGATPLREGGLLGIAVSPDFAQDGFVYAYFTAAQDSRIVRFELGGDAAPEVVLAGITRGEIHNGGRIAFGPDGMLYATVGDGGFPERAQDPSSLNGKILRITPDGDPAPGNPVSGSAIYSLGHRNPQGLAWDSRGRLFAAEFGQNRLDEINLIEPGNNYGWPAVEGAGDTQNGRLTSPLRTWPVAEASPSGIAIYGDTIYMAALRGQRLWTMPIQGDTLGEPTAQLRGTHGRLRTVAIAPDGALWLTTSNTDPLGQPRAGDDRVLRFPLVGGSS